MNLSLACCIDSIIRSYCSAVGGDFSKPSFLLNWDHKASQLSAASLSAAASRMAIFLALVIVHLSPATPAAA